MKLAKPFALGVAALALALLAGCSSDDKTLPGSDAGVCDPATDPSCSTQTCDLDEDCGDPRLFMCNNDGLCEAVCTSAGDCSAHPKFNGGAWPGCDGTLGCSCEERKCVAQACTSDGECGDLVCKAGKCVAPETSADSCKVFPDFAAMRKGQPFTFQAVAYKAGQRAAVSGSFTWSAEDASVELVSGSTFQGKASTAGGTKAAVKATIAGVSCTGKVVVYDDLGTNKARVVVVDEISGRPVTGATVVFDVGDTRTTLEAEANVPGSYVTSTDVGATATVSVFHHDFHYVTVVGTSKKDLLIPVRRLADLKSGGFKGSFKNLPTTAISAGIAGTSLTGNFTDLEISLLLGELEATNLTIGSLSFPDVPLPSGVVVGNKTEYRGFGVAGVCDNEDEVLSGSCGTQSAWGLMGTVPISAVLPIVNDFTAGKGVNIGKALAAVMPYIKDFKSSVARDVSFKLNAGDIDYTKFTAQDFEPTMSLGLKQTVEIPNLPTVAGTPLDGAIVLSTAMVPGRGLVPLGLTAGTDTNDEFATADGKVIGLDFGADGKLVAHNDGKLFLRMAPNHSGTEGSQYAVVALAIPTTGTLSNGAMATTGLVKFQSSLPHLSTVSFGSDFLGLSDSGSYSYRSGAFSGARLVTGASLHRLIFTSVNGHRWSVYFKDANFTVPKVPAGFEDRTMADGLDRDPSVSAASKRADYIAQAIKTVGDVGMDAVFEFAGADARDLNSLTAAFSAYVPFTEIVFVEPKCSDVCEAPAGATTIKVKVNGFDLAQGKVEFQLGTEKKLGTVGSDGLVSVDFTLAAGANTIRARLMANDGTTPIDPIVASELTITGK